MAEGKEGIQVAAAHDGLIERRVVSADDHGLLLPEILKELGDARDWPQHRLQQGARVVVVDGGGGRSQKKDKERSDSGERR